jgi:hypothetical protein
MPPLARLLAGLRAFAEENEKLGSRINGVDAANGARVADAFWPPIFHKSDERIGRAEVDADDDFAALGDVARFQVDIYQCHFFEIGRLKYLPQRRGAAKICSKNDAEFAFAQAAVFIFCQKENGATH